MATNTPNYNLKKPSLNDFFNVQDLNDNIDIIDEELGKANEEIGNLIQNTYTKQQVDRFLNNIDESSYWKASVDTFDDIATTYPTPKQGWTVSVKDTNRTYRYNGSAWIDVFSLISKAELGLDKVDNTSDLEKPISTATQKALNTLTSNVNSLSNTKANAADVYSKTEIDNKFGNASTSVSGLEEKVNTNTSNIAANTANIGKVSGKVGDLTTLSTTEKTDLVKSINEVNAKANSNASNIAGLDSSKANAADVYKKTEVDSKLSGKSDTSHTHDDRYYTETEIDTKLSGKSDTSHNHNSSYYTKTEVYTKLEINTSLSSKSDTSHNHDSNYYTKSEINNKLSNLPTNAESTTYDNSVSGLSATNVQEAIDEVDTKVDDLEKFIYNLHDIKTMTVIIDKTDRNPETCITYADDAIGMTPGSDEWDEFFGHYPCLFKDGKEVGKLNPNDFTKFEDGSSADITSGSAGDVMIAFPKLGYKITSTDSTLTVSMTDNPSAEGFCYLAHTRGTTVKDKFYLGAYKGYVSSSKLRSLSGKTPTVNQTISTFRTQAQSNGSGYDQSAFNQLVFRQCMYLLKYKNLDSQTAVGRGYIKSNSSAVSTGGTNAKGMDFGETTGTLQMKLFGLEDFWGNVWEFIDGIYSDSSRNILTATENFNDTGSGYTNRGASGFSSDTSKWISDVQGTSEMGFVIKGTSGSSSTYYCDWCILFASCLAYFGGSWNVGDYAGAFYFFVSLSASNSSSNISARLMYL